MTALLHAENLSKTFHRKDGVDLNVIDNVSLSLHPGEIVCLLGASGSGKTTLLQMLAGFDAPTSGKIISAIPRPGPRLGYMTQGDTLLPWRTAANNVALGPELLGRGKHEARTQAREWLQKTGLEDFTDSYPHQISGGMRQRVLLARALATEPEIILLDEPMSNLDVLARRQMADIIRDYVRSRKAAALVVTHSVEEACFIADRILLITRSPAVIHAEITAKDATMDGVMAALLQTLEKAA